MKFRDLFVSISVVRDSSIMGKVLKILVALIFFICYLALMEFVSYDLIKPFLAALLGILILIWIIKMCYNQL